MPSANFLLIARKVFQHLETVQNDTKRREKPKIHWAKLTQNEAEYSVRESYGKELFVLLSERPWVRIPPGTPANTPKTFDLSGFSAFLISAAFVAFLQKTLVC